MKHQGNKLWGRMRCVGNEARSLGALGSHVDLPSKVDKGHVLSPAPQAEASPSRAGTLKQVQRLSPLSELKVVFKKFVQPDKFLQRASLQSYCILLLLERHSQVSIMLPPHGPTRPWAGRLHRPMQVGCSKGSVMLAARSDSSRA